MMYEIRAVTDKGEAVYPTAKWTDYTVVYHKREYAEEVVKDLERQDPTHRFFIDEVDA